MKKLLLTSVLALASISFVSAPMLRAQDSITIKDPAEFNAYQLFTSQTDLTAKAAAGETFLTTYPQSVVKKNVLDTLMDTYQGLPVPDLNKALSAASRMLQLDPNYMRAIVLSVYVKEKQCGKTQDVQTCDDAAALARKGLTVAKPAEATDADWKTTVDTAGPIFHSAIALDDAISKKDFKGAVDEYRTELMLLPVEQTKVVPGLMDTLLLAEAYTKPDAKDVVQAIWFYCRAWNFAPAGFKGQIEPKIEYWYKRFHGNLDGLNDIKAQAALTVFPPGTMVIKAAPTPAERIHDLLASTADWNTLALADKELVLALGAKEDADKLWALLQGKPSPVPGIVIEATASVIKVAVTQDAKDAKTADFIVNLKEPLADKDIPAAGTVYKLMSDGGPELDGTYDTYTQIPATATTSQSAQIVLKDAFVQAEKKKAAPAHKPAAGHKPAAH